MSMTLTHLAMSFTLLTTADLQLKMSVWISTFGEFEGAVMNIRQNSHWEGEKQYIFDSEGL